MHLYIPTSLYKRLQRVLERLPNYSVTRYATETIERRVARAEKRIG